MNVVITDAALARLTFDAPVVADVEAYNPSNYAIKDRLSGENVPLDNISLILDGNGNATAADLHTRYYFLRRGVFSLSAFNLSYASGSAVSSDAVLFRDEMAWALPHEVNGSYVSVPASPFFFAAQKALFNWVPTTSTSVFGQLLYAVTFIIHALGGDEPATGGIAAARDGLVLSTATGSDLDVIGQNYGVPRPKNISDDLYRKVIVALAFQPKLVLPLMYDLLSAILGPQEDVHWQVYEVRPATVTIYLGNYALAPAATVSSYLLTPSTEVTASVRGNYLTSTSGVANAKPLFLNTAEACVPVLTVLFDVCKAAGVKVEFKR